MNRIEDTYSQKTRPHSRLESGDFGTACTNAFLKVYHDRPKILDLFQGLCDFLQDGSVVWSREDTDKIMSLSNDLQINTWTKENLLQFGSSLGCICEATEETIDRQTLLPRGRHFAGSLVEHIWMGLGLDDLE